MLLKPQEIPVYVAEGSLDCGITGYDWILETGTIPSLRTLLDLRYSKRTELPVKWVLAVANSSPYQTVEDLKRQKSLRVSTELKNVVTDWLATKGVIADISFSWGATEAKIPVFTDAIVDATETGESLRANDLRVIDVVLESMPRFIANKSIYAGDEWKQKKMVDLSILLKSCLLADSKANLQVIVPSVDLSALLAMIPQTAHYSTSVNDKKETILDIILDKDEVRPLLLNLANNGVSQVVVTSPSLVYQSDK